MKAKLKISEVGTNLDPKFVQDEINMVENKLDWKKCVITVTLLIMTALLAAILTLLYIQINLAPAKYNLPEDKTFVVKLSLGDIKVNVDVKFSPEEKLQQAVRTYNYNFNNITSLYDYNEGSVVHRDDTEPKCMLGKFNRSMDDDIVRISNMHNQITPVKTIRPMKTTSFSLPDEFLNFLAGPNIKSFCDEIPTFIIMENDMETHDIDSFLDSLMLRKRRETIEEEETDIDHKEKTDVDIEMKCDETSEQESDAPFCQGSGLIGEIAEMPKKNKKSKATTQVKKTYVPKATTATYM